MFISCKSFEPLGAQLLLGRILGVCFFVECVPVAGEVHDEV